MLDGTQQAVNTNLTCNINICIDEGKKGDFDRHGYLKIFGGIYQKTFAMTQLSDIGVNSMTYQVCRFPLANAADAKITNNDTVE